MGLGPPVCGFCKVLAAPTPVSDPRYGDIYYHCPKCGRQVDRNLWEYSTKEQQEIIENSRKTKDPWEKLLTKFGLCVK